VVVARLEPTTPPVPAQPRSGRALFLAPDDIRKGRVHSILYMRTCDALAESGMDVELWATRARLPDGVPREEVWRHYGIARRFRIRTLPMPRITGSSNLAFQLGAGLAASGLAAGDRLRTRLDGRRSLVYSRSPILLAPFALAPRGGRNAPVLLIETHALPKPRTSWIFRRADLVVTNSGKLRDDIIATVGCDPRAVLHAPLGPYNNVRSIPQAEARHALDLPPGDTIACHTGKMTVEQNELILGAAALLAARVASFRLLFVGGNPRVLEWTRRRVRELNLEKVVLLPGFVPPAVVDVYQSAADVLVHCIPRSTETFAYATSGKAYEYMRVGRRIVSTDWPLFAEVFGPDAECAIRAPDITPQGLAAGVERALALPDGGRAMIERARRASEGRTWLARVDLILRHVFSDRAAKEPNT
jgi:glycosyltransferase involved in cell wall biosynthesis